MRMPIALLLCMRRMHWLAVALAAPLVATLAPVASADFAQPRPGEVTVQSVPGSDNQWQEARGIVDAPPEAVRRWLTEYEYWPARFRDVKATRVQARGPDRARVWVKSDIMRELTLEIRESPGGIAYTAEQGDVHAAGVIHIRPTPDGRTDVTFQTTASLSGFLGHLIPKGMLRSRQREKIASDLGDLHRLAAGRQSSARRDPPQAARRAINQ